MDSVETVIRFRQSPPEGDITSVTISIVLDVSTGYIVKNGSGWCTWVGEKTEHTFSGKRTIGYNMKKIGVSGGGGGHMFLLRLNNC